MLIDILSPRSGVKSSCAILGLARIEGVKIPNEIQEDQGEKTRQSAITQDLTRGRGGHALQEASTEPSGIAHGPSYRACEGSGWHSKNRPAKP